MLLAAYDVPLASEGSENCMDKSALDPDEGNMDGDAVCVEIPEGRCSCLRHDIFILWILYS